MQISKKKKKILKKNYMHKNLIYTFIKSKF